MTQTVEYSSLSGEEQLLLREFSHRINNEFASVISIISVAAARATTDDAKSVLALARDQLNNYAKVHHALQIPEHNLPIDATAYVSDLCKAISKASLHDRGIQLILLGRKFKLESERCWRLGLIVSELVSNAARHAFSRRGGGVIHVKLAPSLSSVQCRITDNGKSESTARTGNGLKIVTALANSLGGRFVQHFGPRGTRSVLIFPQAPEPARVKLQHQNDQKGKRR
jgi:two-component sensor histidine kinase